LPHVARTLSWKTDEWPKIVRRLPAFGRGKVQRLGAASEILSNRRYERLGRIAH
jgi:hypothetical protein